MITGIRGVIFDLDGTLLDSMPVWENVAANFLISRGVTPRSDLNDDLITLGGHEIPTYFQVEYGIKESAEEINRGLLDLLENFYFNIAPLKVGVADTLRALHERSISMCIATATDRWLVEPALKRCGIFDFFGRIFTCGEEKTSKNSPDIYLRAAAFMGTDIAATLVVEDALYAIKSANDAGFPIVAVYDLAADAQQAEIKQLCDYYFITMDEMLSLFVDH